MCAGACVCVCLRARVSRRVGPVHVVKFDGVVDADALKHQHLQLYHITSCHIIFYNYYIILYYIILYYIVITCFRFVANRTGMTHFLVQYNKYIYYICE